VVAIDENGLPSFGRLQERTGWKGGRSATTPHPTIPILYYVFDILHDGGLSLADVPLQERRKLLAARLLDGPSVRLLGSFGGEDGTVLLEAIREQGQEGVVAKRLASRYQAGKRSKDWVKVKAIRTQTCVVVGFTPPQGGRRHFGSLAVATFDRGKLTYAGQVGSGFDERTLREIEGRLKPLPPQQPPAPANLGPAPREVTWVSPELVCEVKYNEWTREGVLRQPTFLGMRPDKTPEDCQKETPAA